jgi:hypothetical protein
MDNASALFVFIRQGWIVCKQGGRVADLSIFANNTNMLINSEEWLMTLCVNDRVRLESFWGTKIPPESVEEAENYWKLVGEKGVVIQVEDSGDSHDKNGLQVLVQFDRSIEEHGLSCHNVSPNSLWIFVQDLGKL